LDNNVISDIKKRLNIVDIISNYVTLKKRGSRFIGLCPFHQEKTGSFTVDPDKGFYKCFGCGESGDIFTFIQKYENLEFSDTLKLLAEKAGVELEYNQKQGAQKTEKELILSANAYAVNYFKEKLNSSNEALSYLYRRGITKEAIDMFSLGFVPDEWNGLSNYLSSKKIDNSTGIKAGLLVNSDKNTVYDRFRNRIIFPIFNALGKPIAFGGRITEAGEPKYLNSPETLVFNKSKEFYGLNLASKAISKLNQVIIVEGYMDVIACHMAGVTNVIAVLGTALTKDHVDKITRYTKNVVLCFDADSAGIKAALKSGELFLQSDINVKIASTPNGEDPDSFLKNNSSSLFLDIINNSINLLEFEVNNCLKGFNLNSEEERSMAIIEASKIIAKEPSVINRERLIGVLTPLHPNAHTSRAEEHIRSEINRHLKYSNNISNTNNSSPKQRPSKYTLTQKIILAGLCNGKYPLDIFDKIDSSYFSSGFFNSLARILENIYINNTVLTFTDLEELIKNQGFEKDFYDLISIDDNAFNNKIDDLINILITTKNKGNVLRKNELTKKLEAGQLSTDEYNELLILIRGK